MNKTVIILAGFLSGCSATVVSYNGGATVKDCPPVIQVTSLGNSVTITDGMCKKENKEPKK